MQIIYYASLSGWTAWLSQPNKQDQDETKEEEEVPIPHRKKMKLNKM